MKTVLITGASGFIGSHAVERFAREGWRVFGLVHRRTSPRLQEMMENHQVELLKGDAGNEGSVRYFLNECRRRARGPLSVIAHCAGRASDIGWDSAFRHANYDSVRYMGKAVEEGAAARFVFVSSTDVYGLIDHQQADEDHTPLRAFPRNPYPLYKIRAEEWLRKNLSTSLWSIVRPAAVWGPGDPTLTPRILAFLKHSPFIIHFGAWRGRNRWPLAYVENVAEAIYLAATLQSAAGQSLNVVDSEVTTIDAFYRLLAEVFLPGKRFRTVHLPFWMGWVFGWASSTLSNMLSHSHPIFDPSLYALYSVSRNLDFSNRRWLSWVADAGCQPIAREEGMARLLSSRKIFTT